LAAVFFFVDVESGLNLKHSQVPAQSVSLEMQPSLSDPDSRLHLSGDYVSLIVRMWSKCGDEAGISDGGWRIEVEHIQSGGHWDFSAINELERFLIDFLGQVREKDQC